MRAHLAALAASSLLLYGCAVGPDFVAPTAPEGKAYTRAMETSSVTPGGEEPAQRVVENSSIPADWWQLFRSAELDNVVREAVAGNPSVAAAAATLAQAQQAVLQARGGFYPQADFAAVAERQRGPAFALGLQPGRSLPVFSLYSLGPVVSFAPDVFGLNARRVEQQSALAELQRDQLVAARLAVTGNAVMQALSIGSLRRQIGAIQEILAEDQRNLSLVRDKFAVGRGARADVLTAQTQLANDRALLPPVGQQLAAAEDALAILVGKTPAQWSPPAFDLGDFSLPPELPLSLPSDLVRQRPDILAAQAELHASSAVIGIATAQMYPSFPLSASIDTAALSTTSLFDQSSVVWTLSGGLTAPIFHGGALRAQRQEAVEAFRASLASYRQTVLQALGQVADILRALDHDAELADAEHHALDSAHEALELQRAGYTVGKTDVLRLIDAKRSYQQARLGYTRAQAQRYLDSAALMVAMGGGWWSAP